jgi:hypothetical protein
MRLWIRAQSSLGGQVLGPQFRCQRCGRKGADIDARQALGYFG